MIIGTVEDSEFGNETRYPVSGLGQVWGYLSCRGSCHSVSLPLSMKETRSIIERTAELPSILIKRVNISVWNGVWILNSLWASVNTCHPWFHVYAGWCDGCVQLKKEGMGLPFSLCFTMESSCVSPRCCQPFCRCSWSSLALGALSSREAQGRRVCSSQAIGEQNVVGKSFPCAFSDWKNTFE